MRYVIFLSLITCMIMPRVAVVATSLILKLPQVCRTGVEGFKRKLVRSVAVAIVA